MSAARDLVRTYLRLLETFETDPAAFDAIFHPDIEQVELPNALNPLGQRSDRADLLRRVTAGRRILASQAYAVERIVAQADVVVVEAAWSGTMAIAAGPLAEGQVLRAHFCMVFELRDGRIWRQRNYDCFEPQAAG